MAKNQIFLYSFLILCLFSCNSVLSEKNEGTSISDSSPEGLISYGTDNLVQIWTIGDSITAGAVWGYNSYRDELFQKLTARGFSIDFLGTDNSIISYTGYSDCHDVDQDGYPGYRICDFAFPNVDASPYNNYYDQYNGEEHYAYIGHLYKNVTTSRGDLELYYEAPVITAAEDAAGGSLDQFYTSEDLVDSISLVPDIVLVMLGTNDLIFGILNEDYRHQHAVWMMGLVDKILSFNSHTTVIVGTIPPMSDRMVNDTSLNRNITIDEYNRDLKNAVIAHNLFNTRLYLADINAGLELDSHISNDGVHPNIEGYSAMADIWCSVLLPGIEAYRASLQ